MFFPYNVLAKPDRLATIKQMVPYKEFHSELSGGNILSQEYDNFAGYLKSGLTIQQSLKKIGADAVPLTGSENYEITRQIWKRNNCRNMLDYLKIYNLADVEPMLRALENQQKFYFEKKIHMTKDHVTLPSLCLNYLFSFVNDGDT